MANTEDTTNLDDPFELIRFVKSQESVYARALSELKDGEKRSHWMWFIFPQIDGLGRSATARRYAIRSIDEARAYMEHPVLGTRLQECSEAVLAVEGRTASAIFGFPDTLKFKSCMTLFASVQDRDPESVFERALEKYFLGKQDARTLELLEEAH